MIQIPITNDTKVAYAMERNVGMSFVKFDANKTIPTPSNGMSALDGTMYLYQQHKITNLGTLSYGTNTFTDASRMWAGIDKIGANPRNYIVVTNSDSSKAFGYIGTSSGHDLNVFSDISLSTAGFDIDVSAKTPSSYIVYGVGLEALSSPTFIWHQIAGGIGSVFENSSFEISVISAHKISVTDGTNTYTSNTFPSTATTISLGVTISSSEIKFFYNGMPLGSSTLVSSISFPRTGEWKLGNLFSGTIGNFAIYSSVKANSFLAASWFMPRMVLSKGSFVYATSSTADGMGLILNYKDVNNYTIVYVGNNGTYIISYTDGNISNSLRKDSVIGSANILSATSFSGNYVIYYNDRKLGIVSSIGGYVGYFSDSGEITGDLIIQ